MTCRTNPDGSTSCYVDINDPPKEPLSIPEMYSVLLYRNGKYHLWNFERRGWVEEIYDYHTMCRSKLVAEDVRNHGKSLGPCEIVKPILTESIWQRMQESEKRSTKVYSISLTKKYSNGSKSVKWLNFKTGQWDTVPNLSYSFTKDLNEAKRIVNEENRLEGDLEIIENEHYEDGRLEKPSVLQKQEGGSHYKGMAIEPAEYISKNKIGFLAGNAIKYLSRYPEKNGAEDIKKAIHYCEMILEFEYNQKRDSSE